MTGTFETLDWQAWQRAVELTLRSAVELTRAVLPGMRERRWGRVIHVTSLAVKQPIDGLMLSTSIRAAVTGFSRTLANEVAADRVTVNTVLPGFMNTERVAELNQATAAREQVAVDVVDRHLRAIQERRPEAEAREHRVGVARRLQQFEDMRIHAAKYRRGEARALGTESQIFERNLRQPAMSGRERPMEGG